MTEYRGSSIFVAHCQHCKLKTLLNNTIDPPPPLPRRVVQTWCIRIHAAPGYRKLLQWHERIFSGTDRKNCERDWQISR